MFFMCVGVNEKVVYVYDDIWDTSEFTENKVYPDSTKLKHSKITVCKLQSSLSISGKGVYTR